MSLGSHIYELRTKRGMSQSKLAEELGVSRQSVSKWETDTAVPDLDKLIKMSQLFLVTLDELVTGEQPPRQEQPTIIVQQRPPLPARIIVGGILLAAGFATLLVCSILGGLLEGLVLSLPFWIIGAFCFIAKKNVILKCCWALYPLVNYVLVTCTSLHWRTCFAMRDPVRLVAGVVQLGLIGALVFFTARTQKDKPLRMERKQWALYALGWCLWLLLLLLPNYSFGLPLWFLYALVRIIRDLVLAAGLAWLVPILMRYFGQRKNGSI